MAAHFASGPQWPSRPWWLPTGRLARLILGLVLIAPLLICAALRLATPTPLTSTPPTATPTQAAVAAGPAAPAAAPIQRPTNPAEAQPAISPSPQRITLRHGDTLWGLAHRYGTAITTLQSLNNLATSTRIYAGHPFLVPATSTVDPPKQRTNPIHVVSAVAQQPTITGPNQLRQLVAAVFGAQANCAANIILRESGWNVHATNRTSGAYGLGQALPATKMAAFGPDWRDNPDTQLNWMREYVTARYGGACQAWTFWQAHSWY